MLPFLVRKGNIMFYKLQAHLLKDLGGNAASVLSYIINNAQFQPYCFAEIATIATACRVSRSTVKRSLEKLEEEGYVKVKPQFTKGGKPQSNHIFPQPKCFADPPASSIAKAKSKVKAQAKLDANTVKAASRQIAIIKSAIKKSDLNARTFQT